jgi:hypothetical protein
MTYLEYQESDLHKCVSIAAAMVSVASLPLKPQPFYFDFSAGLQ